MTAPKSVRTGDLVVQGLSHSYAGVPAVEDVSFEIPAGETAALLGPSGCGKSTVLRAIAGLIRPNAGSIVLNGKDLSHCRPGRAASAWCFKLRPVPAPDRGREHCLSSRMPRHEAEREAGTHGGTPQSHAP